MLTVKFKKFEFKAFLDFIWDLIHTVQIGQIRFSPHQSIDLFNEHQLTHIGPKFDLDNQGDFLYVWSRNKQAIRIVTYEQFHKNGTPKIKMTFDLDAKTIKLESAEGIQDEEIRQSLEKFFKIKKISSDINKWWKYTHPIWWIWVPILFLWRDVFWKLLLFVWEHKLISGIIILILLPLLVQLLANYLTHKFGWNQ